MYYYNCVVQSILVLYNNINKSAATKVREVRGLFREIAEKSNYLSLFWRLDNKSI